MNTGQNYFENIDFQLLVSYFHEIFRFAIFGLNVKTLTKAIHLIKKYRNESKEMSYLDNILTAK